MNEREVVRRLRAFQVGRPVPSGATRHIHVAAAKDALVVAFIRMGGESRPWGIAWGYPGSRPKIRTVPEARNRDLVTGMTLEFAPTLLAHLRHHEFGGSLSEDWHDLRPLRQIWVPNDAHLEMLNHLAYAYAFTKEAGDQRRMLNQLGRACGWLFREAQRGGEMHVQVGTRALREAFTFPAEPLRQSHLGFLLAWLGSGTKDQRRRRSAEAERMAISTSLDPDIERDIQPAVEQWNTAHRADDEKQMTKAAAMVHRGLVPELKRRWQLTADAIDLLANDKRRVNQGVASLIDTSLEEQWFQYNRLERRLGDDLDGPAFFPGVETDRHPAAAAARYQVYTASAEFAGSVLLHDDGELQAAAIAAGEAFRGEIVSVRDEGIGKTTTPVWVVRDSADRQLRLRRGSRVDAIGYPARGGVVREIIDGPDGAVDIVVQFTRLKTGAKPGPGDHRYAPADTIWQGKRAGFVSSAADGLSRRKAQLVWNKDGPGAWLTHGRPGGFSAQPGPDDTDDVAAVDQVIE